MVLNGGDWNAGKKSFQLGIRLMFTGCASPAYRMRRSASPDEDTMSYWPPPPSFISETISSELPAYLAFTVHPVCCWKGLTHLGSRYPSQAMRLSCPSPLPTFCSTGRLAVGTVCPEVLPPPFPPALCEPLPPLLLQAAVMRDSAATPNAIADRKPDRCLVVIIVTLPWARIRTGAVLRNVECLLGPPG